MQNKLNRRQMIAGTFALGGAAALSRLLGQNTPVTLSIGYYEIPAPSPFAAASQPAPVGQSTAGKALGGLKNLAKKGVEAAKQATGERFVEPFLIVSAGDIKYYIHGVAVDGANGKTIDPSTEKQSELRVVVRMQADHDTDYAARKKDWKPKPKNVPYEVFPSRSLDTVQGTADEILATILDTGHAINGQKFIFENSPDKKATNGTAAIAAILSVLGACGGSGCPTLDNIKGVSMPGAGRGLIKCNDFPVEDMFAGLVRAGEPATRLVEIYNEIPRVAPKKKPTPDATCVAALQ